MSIKLIALDLDGTLLDPNRSITPKVKAAIADAARAGIKVVIASGRMLPSALPVYRPLGIDTPLICCNGAYVCTPEGQMIHRCPIEKPEARQVIEFARENHLYIQYYIGNDLYCEQDCEERELYGKLSLMRAQYVPDLTALPTGTDKLLMIHLPTMSEWMPKIEAAFKQLAVTSSMKFYAEINHPDANKGVALKALADYYGFAPDQVMAIGDGSNDLAMLRWAGCSVAMGNAGKAIQEQCKHVCPDNAHDGVAHAIWQLALER
jgi:Cof subfamily protein (haloacid dehalogenase superfamily)